MKKKLVIVGLSGGVDSSVAALLLKQQGYAVHGIFMKNWEQDDDDPYCKADQDLLDAKKVSEILDISFSTVNFANTYWDKVFKHFLDEYAAGNTPNPDILCNKEIKFKAFLDYALEKGADLIATGHYVRKVTQNNHELLLRAIDQNKDQSYFLYTLGQQQLRHCLFPIGDIPKTNVRMIAKSFGLPTAAKKDSTGICFIGERKFDNFLKEYLLAQPGPIITEQGTVIGQHDGLMFYTLGQRQGLSIGGKRDAQDLPWYVIGKDMSNKTLIVGQGHDHPRLFSKTLNCEKLHWIAGSAPDMPLTCTAKVRYRQKDASCEIIALPNDHYRVNFTEPQWAITPGQSVVFYKEEVCLGGGVILSNCNAA